MNIKKFVAKNNREAIRMVKKEMGPDAVILKSRTIFQTVDNVRSERVEVTAAVDYNLAEMERVPEAEGREWGDRRLECLESELKDIKAFLWAGGAASLLNPEVYFNREIRDRYTHFRDFGLDPEVIRGLMGEKETEEGGGRAPDRQNLRECLLSVLNRVNLGEGLKGSRDKRIFSFVGPTGVGKTTTLAKLAALNAVEKRKKVALVTVDTFRIAAVAQLETYARIMSIPLDVASSRNELQSAIQKHHDCDLILIDTAGRSPNNRKEIEEMSRIFDIGQDIHHYLVLSATTQYRNLLSAEQRFGLLPVESYIFTKLDEVEDASPMVNFLISKSKPVSYFTTGQQVPEDMEPASKRKLAEMILSRKRAVSGNSVQEVN